MKWELPVIPIGNIWDTTRLSIIIPCLQSFRWFRWQYLYLNQREIIFERHFIECFPESQLFDACCSPCSHPFWNSVDFVFIFLIDLDFVNPLHACFHKEICVILRESHEKIPLKDRKKATVVIRALKLFPNTELYHTIWLCLRRITLNRY